MLTPFICQAYGYQVAGAGNSELAQINLVTGTVTMIKSNIGLEVNAIGYNPIDNYIYGMNVNNTQIIRIGSDGSIEVVGAVPNLPYPAPYNVGTFDNNGYYYIFSGGEPTRYYVIDLTTQSSPTYGKLVDPKNGYIADTAPYGTVLSSPSLGLYDWAFNPIDNKLYSINADTGNLVAINPTTGIAAGKVVSGLPLGTYGAVYLDSNGVFYAINNATGIIYRILNPTLVSPIATVFSQSIATQNNDGASCINANVNIDFGDAPDTGAGTGPGNYNSLLASNGPRHQIVNSLFIGTGITAENDALQNPTATGDVDDGLTVPVMIPIGVSPITIPINITNNTGKIANLYSWIDFNKDGIFETSEGISLVVPSLATLQTVNLVFAVPAGTSGNTFMRTRITTDNLVNTGGLNAEDTRSIGPANDGEVEDYQVIFSNPGKLDIVKSENKSFVDVGGTISYTIEVSNTGGSNVDNTILTDIIPSGTSYVQNTLKIDGVANGSNPNTGIILGTVIVPGQKVVISFDISINTIPNPNPISNTATATYQTNGTSQNGTSNTVTAQVNNADLIGKNGQNFVKTVDKSYAKVGDILTYTVTVKNTGNVPANNVVITDPIPNGTTYLQGSLTVDGVGNSSNPGTGITLSTPINPGQTVILIYKVTVTQLPVPNPIPNTASVSYKYTVDPANPNGVTAGRNTNTVTTAVNLADLIGPNGQNFVKTVDKSYAKVGDILTYTVTAKNTGNVPANNVVITDPIPNGTTYLQGSLTVDGGSNSSNPGSGIVLTTPINPGQTVILVYKVTVTQLPVPNPIPNTASVSYSYTADPANPNGVTAGGNTNTVTTAVNVADLIGPNGQNFVKVVDKNYAKVGDVLTYTVTVKNTGNVPANNIIITDPIPNGTTYLQGSLTVDGVANSSNPGSGIALTTSIIPGQTVVLIYKVTVTQLPVPNPIPNTASISYRYTADPANPNGVIAGGNTNTVTTAVNLADLIGPNGQNFVKIVDKSYAKIGDILTYTVTVKNTGNIPANNVIITDPIPNGTSYLEGSLTIDGVVNSSNPGSGIVLTTPVNPGQMITLIFKVKILQIPSENPIPNKANISYNYQPDPANPNNITVSGSSNLVKTQVNNAIIAPENAIKSANKTLTFLGDIVDYQVVIKNTGNVAATNVLIRDILPLGVEFIIGTTTINGASTTQTPVAGIIVQSINPNESKTIGFKVKVTGNGNVNLLENTATIDYQYLVDPTANPVKNQVITNKVIVNILVPNLELTKISNRDGALVGEVIRYFIMAKNIGAIVLNNVVIKDILPKELQYIGNLTVNGNLITGDINVGVNIGTLNIGEMVVVAFDAKVISVPSNKNIDNIATSEFEYTVSGNKVIGTQKSPINTVTIFSPNYEIIKEIDKDSYKIGDIINYKITVKNTGDIILKNLLISDNIPTELEVISIVLNGVTLSGNINLGINIGDLAINEVKIIYLSLKALNTLNNFKNIVVAKAQAISDSKFPAVIITKQAEANKNITVFNPKLSLEKTVDRNYVISGDIIEYKIVATNKGNVILGNVDFDPVTIFDNLESNLAFVVGTITIDGVLKPTLGVAEGINIGILNPGESRVITFKVKVLSNLPTITENFATGTFGFKLPGDNIAQSGNGISNNVDINISNANLTINKKSDLTEASLEDIITYFVEVKNTGTVEATNIILKDTLDKSVVLIEGSFMIGTKKVNIVTIENGVNIGSLKPGESVVISYKVKVVNTNCSGQIKNTVNVKFKYTLPNNSTGIKDFNDSTVSNIIKSNIATFKQLNIDKEFEIPCSNPDIECINEIKSNIDIIEYHVVETANVTSEENQKITGYKLVISGALNILINYTALDVEQTVHSLYYRVLFSTFIILPDKYLAREKIDVEGIVEDIYFKVFDERNLFTNISILVNAKILDY